jgi:hypothetical protein
MSALDNHGFVSRVDPPSLVLGEGGEALVSVDVTVPAGTPDGVPVALAVTASRDDDLETFNNVTATIPWARWRIARPIAHPGSARSSRCGRRITGWSRSTC